MLPELIAKHDIHKVTISWWAMLPELIAKHDIHKVTIPWWAMLPELIAKHDILKQQQSPDSICCLRSLLSMIYQSLMDYAELFNSINTFSFLKCFLLRFCSEVGLISISVSAALLFVFSKFFMFTVQNRSYPLICKVSEYWLLLLFGWAFTRQLTHFLRALMLYNSPLDSLSACRPVTWQD